ncbi:MAG: hypothetical protein ACRDE2_03865 [Chitinophagaceae bacterium]
MKRLRFIIFYLSIIYLPAHAQDKPLPQYPSPMQENVRTHIRLHFNPDGQGISFEINNLFDKPVHVFIPAKSINAKKLDLLIHFHGNSAIVDYSATKYHGHLIAVSITLGAGSSVYSNAFNPPDQFQKLIDSVQSVASRQLHHSFRIHRIIISGFSAGYGAVRKILSNQNDVSLIDDVLLLDGLHANYIPERTPLADGGIIDSSQYDGFLKFCHLAIQKKSSKRFLFTHSEIFPGTFASTTESADFLLQALHIKAYPVLKWGTGGMQQISEVRKNHLEIMGFAGNSAPDHIDHLEGLWYFLNRLRKL